MCCPLLTLLMGSTLGRPGVPGREGIFEPNLKARLR